MHQQALRASPSYAPCPRRPDQAIPPGNPGNPPTRRDTRALGLPPTRTTPQNDQQPDTKIDLSATGGIGSVHCRPLRPTAFRSAYRTRSIPS